MLYTKVYVRLFVVFHKIDSYSYFPTALVRTVPKRVQVFFLILVRIVCLFLFWKVLLALGLLFMDELQRAVAPFYPASGGMAGSSGGSSGGPGWTSFDLGVLSETNESDKEINGLSQPAAPPANPVASPEEGVGPSNPPSVPYPYQPDEVIGGDSVLSIKRRLLAQYQEPSAHIIGQAEIDAEDLFEVKVDIIRQMAGLDPEGDWLGRGARALENPRTTTGEESLEKLYSLRSDLETNGDNSDAFLKLKERVPPRRG